MKSFIFASLAVIAMLVGLAATEECAVMCPMIYKPICATDGVESRTFSNSCVMTAYNCQNRETVYKQLRSGVCEADLSDAPDADIYDILF